MKAACSQSENMEPEAGLERSCLPPGGAPESVGRVDQGREVLADSGHSRVLDLWSQRTWELLDRTKSIEHY